MNLKKNTDGSLTEIDFTDVKYPLKEIIMKFLEHPDSQDQDISEEITLNFPDTISQHGEETLLSTICPTKLTIHETFPLLLFQDNTHYASFAFTQELYDQIHEKQLQEHNLKFCDIHQYQMKINKVRV